VGAYLGTRPETAADAREALLEELGQLSDMGLAATELAEMKEQIKGQILLSLESPAARMHRLAAMSCTRSRTGIWMNSSG
jgi:predicted Zn-dependent peptidase